LAQANRIAALPQLDHSVSSVLGWTAPDGIDVPKCVCKKPT
jgi:hypothetical protein